MGPGAWAIQRCARWPTRRCWSIAGGRVGGGKGAGQGLQELADYRGKLLDEAEWRYRELLEELRRSQTMLEGLTRALPPGGTEESPPGRRWWRFGPG